jgi:hypothetical protein
VDITWMYEQFCGHGWKSDSPAAPCYRGSGADRFFDASCFHPTTEGHQRLVEMFLAVVNE